jgi:tetratricopeptide (TPR) repeat protein
MSMTWDQYMASAEDAYRTGQHDQAQHMWLLAVNEAEQVSDYRKVIMTLDRFADALAQLNKFSDAENVLAMAIEVKTGLFGAEHSEVIGSLNSMVDALHAQKKYDDAVPVADKLLQAYRTVFGAEHPGVASIAVNMASVYHEIKHPQAEEYYKQALAIKSKTLGYSHPDVIALTEKYAGFLADMGREEEANGLLETSSASVSGVWKQVASKMKSSDRLMDQARGMGGFAGDKRRREQPQ